VILLAGRELSDINTLGRELVKPEEKAVSLENGQYQMPAYSFAVLRIPVEAKI